MNFDLKKKQTIILKIKQILNFSYKCNIDLDEYNKLQNQNNNNLKKISNSLIFA